jgi:hypothetical protein
MDNNLPNPGERLPQAEAGVSAIPLFACGYGNDCALHPSAIHRSFQVAPPERPDLQQHQTENLLAGKESPVRMSSCVRSLFLREGGGEL